MSPIIRGLPFDDGAELAAGPSHLGSSGAHLDYFRIALIRDLNSTACSAGSFPTVGFEQL